MGSSGGTPEEVAAGTFDDVPLFERFLDGEDVVGGVFGGGLFEDEDDLAGAFSDTPHLTDEGAGAFFSFAEVVEFDDAFDLVGRTRHEVVLPGADVYFFGASDAADRVVAQIKPIKGTWLKGVRAGIDLVDFNGNGVR